ncbi:TPA: mannose-1-phosphate guanylyltransferase/mannose-6-phosphate isomerase [Burkholderia cepacia]|uniref:mannose-1-phosphate guanylyltransferase/mannose-6-phosphate isomerase n=1 Tax=Burkholderia cepacia TaxID=292 RepID=UPI001CF2864D|nr:mannose-1-phosphate guanylyltransferase/mannose-6-phosphate isomerase [Burkholderia cepacia]MCA8361999.1 mannose-1-phosphate guanylyltransferase/mannose-6-phosphate isomerase [Burkholderia cepacia]HDR9762921.1 mannose-1-phosphate guanylyltransferase/mannose-6-phosphate isomerase [Burkholderia cepacia ATCC 25416]HDV6367353.1 mannose-1-phosphate guanylyltransferase/mannose-6-phosphate isomerase [Burkholderia cepacia]
MSIHPIILCGGNGSRLWPMSRSNYPKQYLKLAGEQTLIQQTVLRASEMPGVAPPVVVANHTHRFMVAEQLQHTGIKPQAIVLEPLGRNTAPAIAVAAHIALRDDPDALLLVLPSDHVVQNLPAFVAAVDTAVAIAKQGNLVTFGIPPTEPHTGYGYIRRGEAFEAGNGAHAVDAFVEKPDRERAAEFIRDGRYYWNSGMFLLNASAYLDDIARHAPDISRHATLALERAQQDYDFLRLDNEAFATCPDISIDYAVMEKTERAAVVVAAELGWSDVGSWSALADISAHDDQGNTISGDIYTDTVANSYIRAEHRMVAAIGVQDVVIVETADAVLVSHRDHVQDVKKVVEKLNVSGRLESVTHRRVPRPWGSYESIDAGDRFQVKRIIVAPGAQLSLQMHHHRAEHWIVVKGTALVTNGDAEIILTENQSTYIPLGTPHRLKNPGKIPLELIEVQSGAYLGEDDIVRFEDTYGRAAS